MTSSLNFQDMYLNIVRRERVLVDIVLTNGNSFRGMIIGFDSFVVILDDDTEQRMIYKHAISAVKADTKIEISFDKK